MQAEKKSNLTKGFLYVVIGQKYHQEVLVSVRSLRKQTQLPIAIITDDATFKSEWFDIIIHEPALYRGYGTKIPGMMRSPFSDKTVFIDTDTFVADNVDGIFDLLDYFQFAMSLDLVGHSEMFIRSVRPDFKLRLEGVLHEFHTGVIGYRNGDSRVMEYLAHWDRVHRELGFKSDMPSFREAFLDLPVSIGILPNEFNFYGTATGAVAFNKVRILHERIGRKWNDRRTFVPSYEQVEAYVRKINRRTYKRIVIQGLGVIPYNWTPVAIISKIKRLLGVGTSSKMNSDKKK